MNCRRLEMETVWWRVSLWIMGRPFSEDSLEVRGRMRTPTRTWEELSDMVEVWLLLIVVLHFAPPCHRHDCDVQKITDAAL